MIYPIILCGGSGSRLWPLSRSSFPKQFAPITGSRSLFCTTASRLTGSIYHPPVIVTGSDFRFIVLDQLKAENLEPELIMIEPVPRNTGPAILASAMALIERDPDAIMLIAPSDHVINDRVGFDAAIESALPSAIDGQIVTFGITPTHAETGYGWLEVDLPSQKHTVKLRRFVEKPEKTMAEQMLSKGNFLWNSGIFLFSARSLIAAVEEHAPDMMAPVAQSVAEAQKDLGFLRLDPAAFAEAPSISIDYAVMERTPNLSVIAYQGGWNDLGSWAAVSDEMGTEGNGNAISGQTTIIDCTNSLLRSESEGTELVGIGLDGLIVIAMDDAVLVADKAKAQDVKIAVEMLSNKGVKQAKSFARDYRPWGHYETLALADRFQVKRIVVKTGASLSLQSHHHRSEHWIVVSGTAKVTINGEVKLVTENESVYIPLGAVHRLENPGKVEMVLIEVQTGSYLEEDDIVRYEDVYART